MVKNLKIVSGLPRSGTSLMMQILKENDINPITDNVRKPDEHNPQGYFEIEDIGNKIRLDAFQLEDSEGCIKIMSLFLNKEIIDRFPIIFMDRALEDVFASMEKMSGKKLDAKEKRALKKHRDYLKEYLKDKNCVIINYDKLLNDPEKELLRLKEIIPQLNIKRSLNQIRPKHV